MQADIVHVRMACVYMKPTALTEQLYLSAFLSRDLGSSALTMHKAAPYFKQGRSVPPQK